MLRYVQSHKKIVKNDKQLIIFITDIFQITPLILLILRILNKFNFLKLIFKKTIGKL